MSGRADEVSQDHEFRLHQQPYLTVTQRKTSLQAVSRPKALILLHLLYIINNMEADSLALVAVPHNPIDHLSPQARAFYQFHGVQMIGSEFPPELI